MALLCAPPADASPDDVAVVGRSNGVNLLHALGPRAAAALAPNTGLVGALVALPKGRRAEDYGLTPVAPGIGRLRAPPARIEAFGFSHPELRLEVAPPLHTLLDRAGQWVHATVARRVRGVSGRGTMIGVADTGVDIVHRELRDANGKTRIRWLLDLSLAPLGVHPDLERRFGINDESGNVTTGAVFSDVEIDALIAEIESGRCSDTSGARCGPHDEIGHGTHVAGLAAARGASGEFPGMAPEADLVIVRVDPGSRQQVIEQDDVVRAIEFMFERADADRRPIVVNVSLGTDFGPHDGSMLWEQAIASFVGPDYPGRAIVAAAGNSGSIVETPIHQSVHVARGTQTRVPIRTAGAEEGGVQVWVTLRGAADLRIGLEGPDGEWIPPVSEGHERGHDTAEYRAGIVFGSQNTDSPIPQGSRGAFVAWQGKWPPGVYNIVLEGRGAAELYMEGLGDASAFGSKPAGFFAAVREGTVNLPATHPEIIGVGCTVSRTGWTSIAGAEVGLRAPVLDPVGGLALGRGGGSPDAPVLYRDLMDGEICWFSSAGPSAAGAPKPEIAAPGAALVSAMSRDAKPGVRASVFTTPNCPRDANGRGDPRCFQIDDDHGVAVGTSMSSPIVAGVIALLFEKDPTLTQDKIVALLQAGAHRFRGLAEFDDQAGPGEVDAWGSLDALDQMRDSTLQIPDPLQSWITLSSGYVAADGSSSMTAILELRTANGERRADYFGADRLAAVLLVDGEPTSPPPVLLRRGPGVWFFQWSAPPGSGGKRATFGATFDGVPIVAPTTVPISTDPWTASYRSRASGSACATSWDRDAPGSTASCAGAVVVAVALVLRARRERSKSAHGERLRLRASRTGSGQT